MKYGWALLLLLSGSARAWPVDMVHVLDAKKPSLVRLPQVDWSVVAKDDVKTVEVEWLAEANEFLLGPLKPGRGLVMLSGLGQVAFWRVLVAQKPKLNPAAFESAQRSCADLSLTPLDDVKLTVTISVEACRQALLLLFQSDAFTADQLRLTFTPEMLQAQLKDMQKALKPWPVTARYVGAGLVLEGKVTAEQQQHIYWALFANGVGRLAVDDRLELLGSAKP
jgi:hypothetical protein